MQFKTWKIILYMLLGLGLVTLFLAYNKIAYFALAPVGFIIYSIESFHILIKAAKWKSISGKEKWDVVFSYIVLIVIGSIIGMTIYVFADSLKDF